ncbi:unnamed protein product [Caenorhabditis auriculariae]|uniref:Uncharacterized protein n=1 Tax=Caenorhabditis auriculariae TaxID=2777116 RepID=A0A8S1H8M0_9PELO|nr:unnamed protein product [Caenorhabditis auriculariae]
MSAAGGSSAVWRDAVAASTLGSGNLRDVVRLPCGEDKNEWLAVNIMDLMKQVRMLYGVVFGAEGGCNEKTCPVMSARGKEYFWTQGDLLLSTPAPTYIDYALTWCQLQLEDENIFPSHIGKGFPPHYDQVCETIMRRLFRVYAHVYHAHTNVFRSLKAIAHLNTSFKQFILFASQFQLIPREELQPLMPLIEELVGSQLAS